MTHQPDTPFDSIENAQEYLALLLEATQEAMQEIEQEILRASSPLMERRKEAMRLATYKLTTLSTHISTSRRLLNDLRMLRRLLLEEREMSKTGFTV